MLTVIAATMTIKGRTMAVQVDGGCQAAALNIDGKPAISPISSWRD
jgi:hypothetical protein